MTTVETELRQKIAELERANAELTQSLEAWKTSVHMNEKILANGRENPRLAEEAVRRYQLIEADNKKLNDSMQRMLQNNAELRRQLDAARRGENNPR